MSNNPQTPDPIGDTTPETARALLWRHGLPEDVIDGALCLHAQELAAAIRAETETLKAHGVLEPWKYRPCRDAANQIDPTCNVDDPAVLPAAPVPPTTHATDRVDLRDRIAAALLARIKRATVSKAQPHDAFTSLLAANEYDLADAVLAVLPAVPVPPTTHAAVLRWAADYVRTRSDDPVFDKASVSTALCAVSEALDRKADEVHPDPVISVTVDELAHAIDNSTPYPIELDSSLCRFMAERLLEMVTIVKRTEHAVWQPDEEPPPGPQPQPEDPSNLPDEEASRD